MQKPPRESKQRYFKLNEEQHELRQNYKQCPQNGSQHADEPEEHDKIKIFKYNLEGKMLNFEFMSDKRVKCPSCTSEF